MDQLDIAARHAAQQEHLRRARRGNLLTFFAVLGASALSGAALASAASAAVCMHF